MTATDIPIRLLLVEDNPGDALLLRSMLHDQSHYEVLEAASVLKAKADLSRRAFDVVFLDLSLPDSDGLNTVDEIHAVAPEVPIVILTGMTDESVAMAAMRRGAQDYLIKGKVDASLLGRAIRYAIDRKQAEVNLQKAHDELERRVQERTADLREANRTLQMIGECNQVLVHLTDEVQLAAAMCRIIRDTGSYRMAGVSYADDDEARIMRVIAFAGAAGGPPESAGMIGSGAECLCGPAGTAIRLCKPVICRDLLADSETASWRDFALKVGSRSSISLPLQSKSRTFGALTGFARESDTFGEPQVATFRELADDLAFGIEALRARDERDRAERVLAHRAEQLRALATELTQAEQRERRRLAHILHDHLQQLLVGAKFNLSVVGSQTKNKAVLETVALLTETLEESIQTARSLTAELSPPLLIEKGLAAGTRWLARQMQAKHGLQVEVAAEPSAEPPSEHMRVFLFDAMRELLFNIVKHAGVKQAKVRLFRNGDEIGVEVSDAGVGFDPDNVADRDGLASGLGLFSIRERLGFLGGRMVVERAPSGGSRITLCAKVPTPAEVPPDAAEAKILETGTAHGGRRIRVLLADDHAIVRQGLGSLLRGEPDIDIVGEAEDGQEAVDMARELRPDVVVMDVSMPRLNGCDATRAIVAELPGTRVVGLSMYDEAEMEAAMLNAGAAAYLPKGGPTQDLIATIRAQAGEYANFLA